MSQPPTPSDDADPLGPAGGGAGDAPQESHIGRPRRQAALGFVFAAALMDIIALGIIIPVLPKLIQGFVGGDPVKAALYGGWFGFVWAVMQFFCSPILGALSDRFGRRPVLLASIFGLGLDYIVMALAPTLAWLFVGRILSGATASSFSTANAYIADVTPPEKRAASFGLMGAAFGIGFVIGPGIGGLLGQFDPRLPFWVAAGLAMVNGLYGLFVLPESLPKDRRSPFSFRRANPLGSFQLYRTNPQLLGLAGVIFLFYLSHQVLQSTFVYYTSYRYHWGTGLNGLALMATGVGSIVVQTLVVKRFVARFGERGALYAGLFSGAVGMCIYGSAATGQLYWLGVPIFAFMGLVGPGSQGLMTRLVSPREQGRLQGANSGMMAIAGLIGPLMFTRVFHWSIAGQTHPIPGLVFYLSASFLLAALVVALRATRVIPRRAGASTPEAVS